MPKPIRKLTDVNLFCCIHLNNFHSTFDLIIQELEDAMAVMNIINVRSNEFGSFYQDSRARIQPVLKVTFIIKSYKLLILSLEFPINSITIVQPLSKLTSILRCNTPAVKEVIFKLAFIDKFPQFIQFSIPIKFGVSELSLENQLLFILFAINLHESIYDWKLADSILRFVVLQIITPTLNQILPVTNLNKFLLMKSLCVCSAKRRGGTVFITLISRTHTLHEVIPLMFRVFLDSVTKFITH